MKLNNFIMSIAENTDYMKRIEPEKDEKQKNTTLQQRNGPQQSGPIPHLVYDLSLGPRQQRHLYQCSCSPQDSL